jgi:septation ring formation regulator EzrA
MAKNVNKTRQNVDGSSREDQFVVLLENVRDEIKLVAEGNLMLQERMEAGFKEVRGDIDAIKDDLITVKMDLHEVKQDLSAVKQDLNSVKQDLNSVKQDLNSVKQDLNSVKQDLNSVKTDLSATKEEMHMGFKGMIAESVKNDEVLAKKADKKEFILLEKRVVKLEIA